MVPSGPGGNNSTKILLIVAAVAVVGVLAVVLLGGGGGGSDASSPDGAVRAWFDSANGGDCAGVVDLSTSSSWGGGSVDDRIAQCESVSAAMGVGQGGPQVSVESAEVQSEDESSAVVEVAVAMGGPSLTTSANVVSQDGQWQVDVDSSFPELGLSEAGGIPGG
jgi:hypothetical protein